MVERNTDIATRFWISARLEPFATPLISLLAGLAVFALLLIVWRWRNQPPGEWFKNLIQGHDYITVLLQANPDPDAMASAMGVEQTATDVSTTVEVVYPGRVAHQENRAFHTVLAMDIDRIE